MAYNFQEHVDWDGVTPIDPLNPADRKYFIYASDLEAIEDMLNLSFDIGASGMASGMILGIKNGFYASGMMSAGQMITNQFSVIDDDGFNIVDAGNIASGLTIGSAGREYDIDIYGDVHMHSEIDGVSKFTLDGYAELDRPVTLRIDSSGRMETVNEEFIEYPSITFEEDRYHGMCCAISYNHYDYIPDGTISCTYLKSLINATAVGDSHFGNPEPQELYKDDNLDINGINNVDIMLFKVDSSYLTFLCANINTDNLIEIICGEPYNARHDLTIPSVFIAKGVGLEYRFNLDAISNLDAELYGGDGVGGERLLSEQIAGMTASELDIDRLIVTDDEDNNIMDVSGSGIVVGSLTQPYDIYSDGDIAVSGMTARSMSILDSEGKNILDVGDGSSIIIGESGYEKDVDIYGDVHMHSDIDGVGTFDASAVFADAMAAGGMTVTSNLIASGMTTDSLILRSYSELSNNIILEADANGSFSVNKEVINYPSISYNSSTGYYDATCCDLTYNYNDEGSHNYINFRQNDPIMSIYSCFAKDLTFDNLDCASPDSEGSKEPISLYSTTNMDFDGESDVDIILFKLTSYDVYGTLLCSSLNTSDLSDYMDSHSGVYTRHEIINSVFTYRGYKNDYIFNLSAITDFNAELYGIDGVGGERGYIEQIAGITASQIDLTGPIINNNTIIALEDTDIVDSFDYVELDVIGCVWNYALKNTTGGNYRAGTVVACWDTASGNVAFDDASTPDLGDTSDFEFEVVVDKSNTDIELRAVIAGVTNTWDVSFSRNLLKNVPTG